MLVAAGTYSPSTNSEVFPIEMASGIHLIGSGEDVSIIDAQQTSRVITMEDCDNNTISDLTLTGGLADSYGGGMNLHTSDPILTNVTISNNTANWGGGMHLSNSNPILTHVTISNNQALQGGGMRLVSSDPILTNVTISNNTASESGGMRLFNSNPILTHVTISNNTAEYYGGGMWLDYSDPILTHVTISNNTAEYYGGGMRLSNSDPILTNVTIANNTANNGGGGMYLNYSDPIMTNSIIWDNSPQSIYTSSGTPLITYSDIEGGWEGEGNIDADPLFCDAENGDLTVQSDSPVLGAGQDGTDMGAYGVGCEPDDVCSACNIYYTDGYPGFCCDMAWDEGGLTCLYVETEWGLDCGGCNCFGDFAFCEDQGLVMCSDYSCAESLSQCPPEYDIELHIQNFEEDGTFELILVNNTDLVAFEFDIPGLSEPDWDFSDNFPTDGWMWAGYWLFYNLYNTPLPVGIYEINASGDLFNNEFCVDGSVFSNSTGEQITNVFFSECAFVECSNPGDINYDGAVDILDIVGFVNDILNPWISNELFHVCGDINEDDEYNILDIVQLVNIILGN